MDISNMHAVITSEISALRNEAVLEERFPDVFQKKKKKKKETHIIVLINNPISQNWNSTTHTDQNDFVFIS